MRLLLTGCSGFVGLAFATHCVASGDDVIGLDRRPPSLAEAELATGPGSFRFVQGDAGDRVLLRDLLGAVDAAVPAAAITAGEERERRDAEAIVTVNVLAVQAMLECARERPSVRLLYPSSGSVYDPADTAPTLDEERGRIGPRALYGATKYMAERMAMRYRMLHGLDIRVARLGTAFGPWEHETGVRDTLSAPFRIMQAHLRGTSATIATATPKDWTCSTDIAEQLRLILLAERVAHPLVNLGSGQVWSALDFAAALGVPVEAPSTPDRPPFAIERLVETTGKRPRFGLAEAVPHYLAWARAHPAAFGASTEDAA